MSAFKDIIIYIFLWLKYVVYSLSWIIINTIQYVLLWNKLNDENTICAFRIIFRNKFKRTEFISSRDFITIYNNCVGTKYLLQENVSLYCITNDHAYFTETKESVNVFRSETNAFQYMAQFEHAVRLLRVPMNLLFELADDIGNPKVRVCCLLNTGRCGSTVLAQALEKVPGSILHAEPDCLSNLGRIWKSKSITQLRYERIFVAIIRFLCKPYHGISLVIIKTRSCSTCHIQALENHFPSLKIIFMFRNLTSTISSILRVPGINKTTKCARRYLHNSDKFSDLFPWLRRGVYYFRCYPLETCPSLDVADAMNEVELLTYAWACNVYVVRKFLQQGGHALLITYDELIPKKSETLKTIFEELDIDLKYMSTASEAFNQDSQRGTIYSWDKKEGKEKGIITESDREKANKVLYSFGLPDINEHVSHFLSWLKQT